MISWGRFGNVWRRLRCFSIAQQYRVNLHRDPATSGTLAALMMVPREIPKIRRAVRKPLICRGSSWRVARFFRGAAEISDCFNSGLVQPKSLIIHYDAASISPGFAAPQVGVSPDCDLPKIRALQLFCPVHRSCGGRGLRTLIFEGWSF